MEYATWVQIWTISRTCKIVCGTVRQGGRRNRSQANDPKLEDT